MSEDNTRVNEAFIRGYERGKKDGLSVPFNQRQEKPERDSVNHPNHYNDGKIEVIDYIEDQKLGFCLGNAIKYISRAGKKDKAKEIEDLRKAIWYINRRILEIKREE